MFLLHNKQKDNPQRRTQRTIIPKVKVGATCVNISCYLNKKAPEFRGFKIFIQMN